MKPLLGWLVVIAWPLGTIYAGIRNWGNNLDFGVNLSFLVLLFLLGLIGSILSRYRWFVFLWEPK